MNIKDAERLRAGTRRAYSAAADRPSDDHPFPVGLRFTEDVGYPSQILSTLPAISSEAFSGVSNVSIFADIFAGSTILDLGCGAGLDSLIAAKRTGINGRVIGIDFSESMLYRARGASSMYNALNVEFCQADGKKLPIGDATIDIVLVNGIFNLNPGRETIFRELARVTREGGMVYASELILKAPLPPDLQKSDASWFA